MEFLAIWRATRDPVALEWAHDLIVNSYRYWGTGETKAFAGTEMPDLSESLYYTRNLGEGEVLFRSIYAVPMLLAALEYCTASNPEDPTAVDLFTPTLNAFHWLEDNLCRKTSRYYADYDKSGSCVVTCTDKLYFVDYGRYGEKGPTGARAAEVISPHGSNTALFGNMGMAACAGMLWRITGKEDYRTVALRTVKAITTTETHRTTGTYINDRDQGTNASTAGYFVRYALTLDGVRAQGSAGSAGHRKAHCHRLLGAGYALLLHGLERGSRRKHHLLSDRFQGSGIHLPAPPCQLRAHRHRRPVPPDRPAGLRTADRKKRHPSLR